MSINVRWLETAVSIEACGVIILGMDQHGPTRHDFLRQ
jgi:hypothetical protein